MVKRILSTENMGIFFSSISGTFSLLLSLVIIWFDIVPELTGDRSNSVFDENHNELLTAINMLAIKYLIMSTIENYLILVFQVVEFLQRV